MSRITEYPESLLWRGKTMQHADAGIKAGEVWDYPLKLEKGVDYHVRAKGGKNVKSMTCSLTDNCRSLTLHEDTGPAPSFSFVPDTDGVYWLHLTLDSTHDPAAPGAVGVTLLRERIPSRVLNAIFGWPVPGVPRSGGTTWTHPRTATSGKTGR